MDFTDISTDLVDNLGLLVYLLLGLVQHAEVLPPQLLSLILFLLKLLYLHRQLFIFKLQLLLVTVLLLHLTVFTLSLCLKLSHLVIQVFYPSQ